MFNKCLQKILLSTLALLLFFCAGGFTIAKASTCSTADLTVSNATESGSTDIYAVNGNYIKGANISGHSAWYKTGTTNYIYFDNGGGIYSITNSSNDYTAGKNDIYYENPIGLYSVFYPGDRFATVSSVSSTTCNSTPPPAPPMSFLDSGGTGAVLDSVESISRPVFDSAYPYLMLVLGLGFGTWFISEILKMFKKMNAEDKALYDRADKAIADSERLRKETTH